MCRFWMILGISFCFYQSLAQDLYNLSGKVVDSNNSPLSPATVLLIAGRDTLTAITKNDGIFSFQNLKDRKFHLQITMKGYQFIDQIMVTASLEHIIQLNPLVLKENYTNLDTVIISRLRPVIVNGDTVTYNAAAFPVSDGSYVEDILKKLPGIDVDIEGRVVAQGKLTGKVLVNGKEFFGDDILLAIRNLPADAVAKLQIIDDYGDQATLTGVKSGEPTKVLNIVLKSDKRNGEFGNLEAGEGLQGKREDKAMLNSFAGERQISISAGSTNNNIAGYDPTYNGAVNYTNKWNNNLNASIALNIDGQSPKASGSVLQDSYYSGEQLLQTQNNTNASHINNSSLNTEFIYKLNNYSSLHFVISANSQQSRGQQTSNYTTLQQDSSFTKSSVGQSTNNGHSSGQNINSNLYYQQIFAHSKNRLSIQLSFALSNSQQFNYNQSISRIFTDSVLSPSNLTYLITNQLNNFNINFRTSYFLAVAPTSFIEIGYKQYTNHSSNNTETQQSDTSAASPVTIDSLSQIAVFRSSYQSFHLGYTGQIHTLSLLVGSDLQKGSLEGTVDSKGQVTSYPYLSLLPMAQIAWKIKNTQKFNLTYAGNPILPSLQQLSPFTNLSNPQYPVIGNPLLRSAYNNSLFLRFQQDPRSLTQSFSFGLGIGYTSTQHPITQNITNPKDSSQVIQETTYLNAGSTGTFRVDYYLYSPAILKRHLRINTAGAVSAVQSNTILNGISYPTNTWV